MWAFELQLRVIQVFLVLMGGPHCLLFKLFPQQAFVQTAGFIWQMLFMDSMSVIKCVNGLDPITEPTIFEIMFQAYLSLFAVE